jgi:hypothetical protein
MSNEQFFGKYRGIVKNDIDPLQLGRVMVHVPDFGALPDRWAMPCVPVADVQHGFVSVPGVGASVWVEFERGDPERPIWVGGFWNSASDVPHLSGTASPGSPSITLQTPSGCGLLIAGGGGGTAAGILLTNGSGATIAIDDSGVRIQNANGASITLMNGQVVIGGELVT